MKTFSPQNNTSEEGVSELFPPDPDLKNAGGWLLGKVAKRRGFNHQQVAEKRSFLRLKGNLGTSVRGVRVWGA
jgi:hypothetical protein